MAAVLYYSPSNELITEIESNRIKFIFFFSVRRTPVTYKVRQKDKAEKWPNVTILNILPALVETGFEWLVHREIACAMQSIHPKKIINAFFK
jgi:hypothetical protein